MKTKRSLYNLITALGAQFLTMLLTMVVPRITLAGYGSEVNGYMSLVTQIYAYLSLLEAGIAGAETQALYGPVTKNDRNKVASVVNTAQRYYHRMTGYYSLAIFVVALIIPLVVHSQLPPATMIGYFLLFGISRLINFWFVASMRPLLQVEGKNYINTGIEFLFSTGSTLFRILLLTMRVDLVLMQLVYSTINVLQILAYFLYFRKKYKWLDRTAPVDAGCLQQKKAYLAQQVSQLVFSCTDVILLSVFCNLKTTSIYSVYMLVFNALAMLIYKVASSAQFVLGQTYYEDEKKYIVVHQVFEGGLITISMILYSTAYILILPFIKLYVAGVADTDYLNSSLPLLFCLIEILSVGKFVPSTLINVSGHAQETMDQTIGEVVINLGISLLLVRPLGILGVLIGTALSLVYRLVVLVRYANRKILALNCRHELRLFLLNLAAFGGIVITASFVPVELDNYGRFVIAGGVISVLACLAFGSLNYYICRKQLHPYIQRGIKHFIRRNV